MKAVCLCVCLLSVAASVAQADSTVTACSVDVQTGAGTNLSQAILAGGNIYFNCPRPTTIYLTQTYNINAETFIWGGDEITLNGAGFIIARKTSTKGIGFWINGMVHFEHMTLSHFALPHVINFRSINAGALKVNRSGSLFLDHVTITDSDTPVGSLGSLTITGSTFLNNTGIAVVSQGAALSIQNTGFSNNVTGVFMDGGTIVGSAFTSNTQGAVIVEYPRFDIQIRDSNFQSNSGASAILLSQLGASSTGANVVLRRDKFVDNDGGNFAGAASIYNPGSPANFSSGHAQRDPKTNPFYATLPPVKFDFEFDTFTNNKSEGGTGTPLSAGALGLDLQQTGGATVRGGLFTGNVSANQGGAISSAGGSLTIAQGVFKQNQAPAGAAIFTASSGGSVVIANSLAVENSASGATLDVGSASIANVTIANNNAVGIRYSGMAGKLSISNSILDANKLGNCQHVTIDSLRVANLQFGGTDCPGVTVVDPQLDSLYVPGFSSAAVGHADATVCRSSPVSGKDVVFQLRDHPHGCTIGAYERPPIRLVPRKPDPQVRS